MPTIDWKLKATTETTAKVFVRSDTTGTAKITVNSTDFTVDLDTTVKDGTGVILITSVSGGAFTLYFDDVEVDTGTLQAHPKAGSRFSIGWLSCMYTNNQDSITMRQMAQEPRLKRVYDQGDTPYVGGDINVFGSKVADGLHSGTVTNAKLVASYHAQHLGVLKFPAVKLLGHTVPYMDGGDDHEWPGDDWDHTTTQLEDGSGFTGTTQADVDAVFIAGYEALRDYAQGAPDNNDADAAAQKPGARGAEPAITLTDADYPVSYYRETIGDAEIFHLDCQTHRGPISESDVSILGSTQLAWLKAHLKASTATWKILEASKMLYQTAGANLDGFSTGAPTEEADIATFCSDSTDWVVPKGVLWIGGDDHLYHWSQTTSPDFSSITACPISTDLKNRTASAENVIVLGLDEGMFPHYGILDIQGSTKIKAYVVDIIGNRRDVGTLYPGSNLLVLE